LQTCGGLKRVRNGEIEKDKEQQAAASGGFACTANEP
jgi:hypothetical protein